MTEDQSLAKMQTSSSLNEQEATLGVGFGGALELPAGRIIAERYKVVKEIGRGGMGVVYQVEQIILGREMALKTLDGHDVKDGTWRRFQQEAKATSMLDHPNLISVHDSGVIDGKHPYFVMDLVLGTTLAKLVEEKGPLSVEEALPIFIQVCFGLAYAHELGIVHRDLKPSNIMLVKPPGGGPFTAKIVDFGIAKLHMNEGADIQGLTKTGEIFGSPLYMSPEQCLGVAVDHRSDIYALGCVLFEALTGLPPFLGNTSLSTMMKHQSEKAPTLKEATLGKEFPKEVEKLVAQLLEKDPEKRYQSLNNVAKDLSLLQQGISAQSLTSTRSILSETSASAKQMSIASSVLACILSALVSGTAAWIIKDQLDAQNYATRLASEMERYTAKALFPVISSSPSETVQSITKTLKNGKTVRRIYFIRPLGTFNIVGTGKELKASGIHEIPMEQSIHLKIRDPDCLETPNFFSQFQPDDVTELTLCTNYGLTDKSMQSIDHLKNLTYLNIADNEITDESIKYLNNLPELRNLYVGFTQMTEDGILRLKRLKEFTNFGTGRIPSVSRVLSKLKNSNKLILLSLTRSGLTNDDLKIIATMKLLEELSLDENLKLDDDSLKLLTPLTNLQRLDVSETKITGSSIPTFKNFPRLKRVMVAINQWSGDDLNRFRATYPNILLTIKIKDKDEWE
ncbi:MAG: hypothetical protein C0469_08730 [Cyanobacteria bacterium DS2.3.42]|nr:hypothetical protein [Cyanobacteria bacterium DS2.3.42]